MNKKKLGVILAYATQVVSIITGLLYTPVMLRLVGQSEYGLYQLVSSVISSLALLNLGFSSSYVKFYVEQKVNGNEDDVARFNGMFFLIFVVISIITAICGCFIINNTELIFGAGLTGEEYRKLRVLFIMMLANLIVTFLGTIFDCAIIANEEFVISKLIALARSILNPCICLPLLICGAGSVGMVGVLFGLNVMGISISIYFSFCKLRMQFRFDKFNLKLLGRMWKFTFFIFLNQIIDQINWTVDKFLLGRFMDTVAVAVYGVASTINTMYLNISTAVSNVFTPQINFMVAKGSEQKKINHLFVKVGRIQYIILMLILTGFIFFGEYFIQIWAGKEYEKAYLTILLLIVPVTIPLIQNLGIDIQRAKNKHQVRSVVYAVISLLNLVCSVILIQKIGFYGAAIGTAFSLVVGNGLFMNWYYHKKLDIDIICFWKNIAKISYGLIIPLIVGIIIYKYILFKNVVHFLCWIIIYSSVYCISMWRFGMNDEERNIIKEMLFKLSAK